MQMVQFRAEFHGLAKLQPMVGRQLRGEQCAIGERAMGVGDGAEVFNLGYGDGDGAIIGRAQMFGAQARSATQGLQPLISEYTSKLIRWIRIISVIAVLLLVGWVAFQIFAQVSMFEWIGDRIDNLSDNSGVVVGNWLQ